MMLDFKDFLTEDEKKKFLSIGGSKGLRHAINYVKPFVGANETLEIGKDHENMKAGTRVRVLAQHEKDNKHYTEVVPEGSDKSIIVPNSVLLKREELIKKRGERGFKAENVVADVLKNEGMMKKETQSAGSSGGHDFHVLTGGGAALGGEERDDIEHELGGESKIDLGAKFGSISLSHHPVHGWQVSEKSRKHKPHFASAIERATVNVGGKPKPLLQHLNDTWGNPSDGRHLPNVTSSTEDDAPAQAYFRDHGVHVLHVHSHGTYRVGDSDAADAFNTNLPTIKGMTGRFTVGRERRGGIVQASFRPHKKSLNKSSVDIVQNPEDRARLKDNLARGRSNKPRSLEINTSNIEPVETPREQAAKAPPRPIETNTVGGLPWKNS